MQKKVHVMKQGAVKKNILECMIVIERVILNIQTNNQMEIVAMRRRINYLCVVGKVTLKILMRKKKNINEEEDIGIRKCGKKILIDKCNEEVRGWTYSSKNTERPPDTKKRDESFRKSKKKVKTSRP